MPPEHDREVLTMMTLKRLKALAGSYGADLQRWPQKERAAARELLDSSEQARDFLEQERSLDEGIAAAAAHRDAGHGWGGAEDDGHGGHGPASEQDAALARLRASVSARIATEEAQQRPIGWPGSRASPLRMRRLGLATSAAFAIIAGLLVGGLYGPAPAPAGALSALLQPATLELLAD